MYSAPMLMRRVPIMAGNRIRMHNILITKLDRRHLPLARKRSDVG